MTNFVRHPMECMQIARTTYGFNGKPIIKLGVSKDRSTQIFDQIDFALDQFNFTVDASIEKFQLTQCDKTEKYKIHNQLELIKSAIDTQFLAKYESDIFFIKTPEELIALLKKLVGTISPQQKQENARIQLAEATRRVDEEEEFEQFYTRLSHLARASNDNKTIQEFLLQNTFEKALNANHRQFLIDQDQTNLDLLEKAKYLDKRNKHKKQIRINEIDTTANNAIQMELINQMSALTTKIAELSTQNATFATQNAAFEAEIFKLKTQPKRQNFLIHQPHHTKLKTAQNDRSIPSQWELNKYGKPYRCRKCGLLGHKDEKCRGTHLTCRKCNKVGHIAPACPLSKN